MKRKQKRLLLFSALVIIAVILAYIMLQPAAVQGAVAEATTEGHAETPFGEYISIKLGTSAQTSAASWQAAVAEASQNVWTVNGTYKSQAQVTLGYSLQISYANVQNIQIVSLYVKAVDAADSSSYTYTLASGKSLTGASPISDSGSTQKSISTHLSEVAASSPATVRYYIYCKVQAQGSTSGQTLTAEVTETYFATLVYTQQTESASATVTPTVDVASLLDHVPTFGSIALAVAGVVILAYAVKPKKVRRK